MHILKLNRINVAKNFDKLLTVKFIIMKNDQNILISNLEDYYDLVKQLKEVVEKIRCFEFKFSDETISQNMDPCSEKLNQE